MDDFLLLHNIAPSSYAFLRNNLSLQIYDTFIMWGWGMLTSCDSYRSTICAYMAIIINEFLPVPNIAASSYILLYNNLSYIICIMFFWKTLAMRTCRNSNRLGICGVVAHKVV